VCQKIKWQFLLPSAILDLKKNAEILLSDGIRMVDMHLLVNIDQNLSMYFGDIVIFRIFKLAAVHHLGFFKFDFFLALSVQKANMHQHTIFHQNRSNGF